MRVLTNILLLFVFTNGIAQNNSIFSRLRAISNSSLIFYNLDGIDSSSQTFNLDFNEKNLKKAYRKYSIKKQDEKIKDTELSFQNYHIQKNEEIEPGLTQTNSYYFIENKDKRIEVIWFGSFNSDNKSLERKLVELIANDQIPKECFSPIRASKINFVGREIQLGESCNWANINNIQCPYYGQMNWSIHATKESAENAIDYQLKATKAKKGGKVLSEEMIAVEFENVPTKAKKVVYDFTGATSLLAGMSGGKTLTIYYVAEKIRDRHLSCVLSHWNNDAINPSGLPALLEEVMKLTEKQP